VLVAIAATMALAPTTSAGATAKAAVTAAVRPANGIKLPIPSAGAMLDVGGQLWVSDPTQSRVEVFSTTGKLLHTIKDLPGALSLLESTNGATIEVSESTADAVAEISTSTYATTGTTWATEGCPWSLAWANGFLAYSYGCNPDQFTSGVATQATPSATPTEILTGEYSSAQLAGSGTTLAVSGQGETPGSVATYTIADGGTATSLAAFSPEEGANVAFSPNGASLLAAAYSDNGATAYDPNTGEQQIAYPGPGGAVAVAEAPNSHYIATGFSGYGGTVNLVNTSSDSTVWTRSLTEPPNSGTTYAAMIPNTLTFSSNSSEVFGLAQFVGLTGIYLFASDLHPADSRVSIKVAKVPAGHKLPVTLTGTPGASVTLTATVGGVLPARKVATKTLPSSGHVKLKLSLKFDGILYAAVIGDAAHLPAKAHTKYTVGSRSVAKTLGGHRSHGVTLYTKLSQVRVELKTTPKSSTEYFVKTQAWRNGHWSSFPTLSGNEVNGRGGVYFSSMNKNVIYRVKFRVPTSDISRGSHVTSGEFELR
jgi:WD40 repeat protein